jgi:catechol 2,3-dioxygenase
MRARNRNVEEIERMAQEQQTQYVRTLPPTTIVGEVQLKVADLDEALFFYQDILGYQTLDASDTSAVLTSGSGRIDFVLIEISGALPVSWRTTGLFHAAILLPERRDLARIVRQLTDRGWDIGGASDHGVSEALYLNDADGNSIEIYVDRPQDQWPTDNGRLRMVTERLDFENLFRELQGDTQEWERMPEGTRIGHVHLQVSDLEASRNFYTTVLGFEVTQDSYPGALFMSAGGYHHHIGINVWAGRGVPRPDEKAVGLKQFSVFVPEPGWDGVLARLSRAGIDIRKDGDGTVIVSDPDGIDVQLRRI